MTAWPESPKVPRGDVGGTLQGGRRLRGQGRPEREGGRSERSRRKRESRERGGTRGDARFGEDSPGRYHPLRSQKPERIQCPGEKAATAAAEPCPGDARAGTTHRACAVPPSGRASRGSQATTPASRRLGSYRCQAPVVVSLRLSRVLFPPVPALSSAQYTLLRPSLSHELVFEFPGIMWSFARKAPTTATPTGMDCQKRLLHLQRTLVWFPITYRVTYNSERHQFQGN